MRSTLLLLLSLVLLAAAPEPTAEMLRARLPGLQGQARILALHELVNKIETRAPQEGLALADEGLTLARQLGDKEKEAAFLSSMAFCYGLTGDFALSVLRGKESLELSRQIGNKDRMARAHNVLGITYTYMGAYSQALEEHLESLRIRDELSLETASLQSLNNIGVLYHNMGQYEKAIYYFQKSMDRNTKNQDTSRHILLKLNIGFANYKLGRLTEALKCHLDAMELINYNHNRTMLAYAYYNLGMTYTDLKEFSSARKYLYLALSEYEKQDQKHARIQVLNAMGRFYLLSGRPSNGIPLVKEAIQLAQNIKTRNDLLIGYELLSELYKTQPNLSESFKYYKLYVRIFFSKQKFKTPHYTVCPACNSAIQPDKKQKSTPQEIVSIVSPIALFKKVIKYFWPKENMSYWIIGLFEKI